ncbi:efflux RND transporter periplasmic adaptor subunit [Puniceibacterium sp. IMCC21224]|uniref:efflux RND transporter periplasmic adaptor subunit n=1 Tax=Puniceibacterium sp. IMCC21224 TaxID=1618204 RepID=UPI00064D7A37|nr:HlyD family efflux transporter periplasmic adaptor subunit [Puniceibacterium sp. IMCC21224]KMK66593.1 HlyD family secretion protein [Puniceibacterium sp. IMCC21224]
MRFLRQSLTGLFLVSLTLGLLVYAGALVNDAVQVRLSDTPRVPQARERVFAVNVITAGATTETPVLEAFGQVQSRRTLELRSATTGRLVSLAPGFEEGGHVTAGQLLAQIDPADAEAALERVRSDLLDAEAETREAVRAVTLQQDTLAAAEEQAALYEKAFQRQLGLEARGVGTAATVEAAELSASNARASVLNQRQSLAQAEARVDQAKTLTARSQLAVEEAQRRLDDTAIRAGFDGMLSDVSVVEGRLVSANEQLGMLIDPDALEVAFRVSTQGYARLLDDAGTLRPAPVTVTLDVYGTDLVATGALSRDSASVGEGQTGRQIFARLDAAPGFKPGDFITVSVQEAPVENVVRLPATAVDANGSVLVLAEDERLEAMQVTLVRRQGDDVLVRADALPGRDVVAERTPLLGAGIKVRTLTPAGDTSAEQVAQAAPPAPTGPDMLELTDARRAKLVAFVEDNNRMPPEAKQRILAQLAQTTVPAQVVQRLEDRIGG